MDSFFFFLINPEEKQKKKILSLAYLEDPRCEHHEDGEAGQKVDFGVVVLGDVSVPRLRSADGVLHEPRLGEVRTDAVRCALEKNIDLQHPR